MTPQATAIALPRPRVACNAVSGIAAVSAGAALLAACGSRTGAAHAADADVRPGLVLVEQQRIGSRDDPDEGFSFIGNVDVDRDGQIYAVENQAAEIRVFAPDGRLLRRIGRQGAGPGEFRSVSAFGVHGDTVWVVDVLARRITLFDRTGRLLRTGVVESHLTVDLPGTNYVGLILPVAMAPDGLFRGDMVTFMSRGTPIGPGNNPPDTVTVPKVRFTAAGGVADTAGWELHPSVPIGSFDPIEIAGRRYIRPNPPSARPLSASIGEGRLWVLRAPAALNQDATFRVIRLDAAGDTLFRQTFHYQPTRYSDAFLDAASWRAVRAPMGGVPAGGGAAARPELRLHAHLPDHARRSGLSPLPATRSTACYRRGCVDLAGARRPCGTDRALVAPAARWPAARHTRPAAQPAPLVEPRGHGVGRAAR